jgi:serine/threonine-protein kinase ULK/ATG1
MKREIEIIEKLYHPNIVRLFDLIRTKNNNYLVMEYCGGGDLREFLKSRGRLTEPVA